MEHGERLVHIERGLTQALNILTGFLRQPETCGVIAKAAAVITDCFRRGGRVLSCGNGGSMCDAMHFAEELSGRFRDDRRALSAIAIGDSSHLTCVANDYGFEAIFSRGVEAHGRPGDVLLAISTSGRSPNIIAAVNAARAAGMVSIALTGRINSKLASLADIDICAVGDPNSSVPQPTERTQELHIKIIHLLIEMVERDMFPENYTGL